MPRTARKPVGPAAAESRPLRPVTTVNVHEAKTNLSRLLTRVRLGEEVVIALAGQPVARLVALREKRPDRVPGSAQGMIRIGPDFDAPLPDLMGESGE